MKPKCHKAPVMYGEYWPWRDRLDAFGRKEPCPHLGKFDCPRTYEEPRVAVVNLKPDPAVHNARARELVSNLCTLGARGIVMTEERRCGGWDVSLIVLENNIGHEVAAAFRCDRDENDVLYGSLRASGRLRTHNSVHFRFEPIQGRDLWDQALAALLASGLKYVPSRLRTKK